MQIVLVWHWWKDIKMNRFFPAFHLKQDINGARSLCIVVLSGGPQGIPGNSWQLPDRHWFWNKGLCWWLCLWPVRIGIWRTYWNLIGIEISLEFGYGKVWKISAFQMLYDAADIGMDIKRREKKKGPCFIHLSENMQPLKMLNIFENTWV